MKKQFVIATLFVGIGIVIISVSSCGVKGPPLPPIPLTPQRSDRTGSPSPSPSPSLAPSPEPSATLSPGAEDGDNSP